MARNLSRRRVLTHKDFMTYGTAWSPSPTPKPKRGARRGPRRPSMARWASVAPAKAAEPYAYVDPDGAYACPDGACCGDPDCVRENRKRGVIP